MIDLASRISKVNPSLTLAVTAKAKAMKAEGLDVCSFSAGEPDFDTPSHIKEAAKTALDEGKTKYGNTSGELALRQAIVDKLARQGLTYDVDNIIATNGGKHSLFDLMMALIEEGDEVIIPTPYWVSYPEMVTLAGGTSVLVRTTAENDYKITPEQLTAAITPKTKLFVFNSPSNPTGTVYTREEITALAQVVVDHDILVVSDEIYEYILYDGAEHVSMASISPEIYERTLISNGFAKGYSMTGWRIGYIAGPKRIVKAMTSVQGHSTSNICTFAQYGAIAALEGSQNCVKKMLSAFTERRKYVLNRLKEIPNITCSTPMGAFYVFIDVSYYGLDSITFCERLLNEQYVATIPGKGFGDDNCIRISYATSLGVIEKGLDRFEKFLANL